MVSAVASAQVATTTGAVQDIAPPPSVQVDDLANDSTIFTFAEAEDVVLTSPLALDITATGTYAVGVDALSPGSVAAGTHVCSHMLHFDPVVGGGPMVCGSLTLDAEILGVILVDSGLDTSDTCLGNPTTAYPTGLAKRGLENAGAGAQIGIGTDRRTLTAAVPCSTTGPIQIRMIVRPFPPYPLDSDGDGVPDDQDICPGGDDNVDGDGDGVPDFCDPCPLDNPDDTDGDGVCDDNDLCPGFDDNQDGDGDTVADGCDNCPLAGNSVQTDTDDDGAGDACDGCVTDPAKTDPGICGCGTPDVDTDSDGTADCIDGCAADPAKISPGVCGCGTPDTDTDGDGVPDCVDDCPIDPHKSAAGLCGCGTPDDDLDIDGTPDCNDNCAMVANIDQTDSDGDSFGDACDNCPLADNEDQNDSNGNGIGDVCDACFAVNRLKIGTKQAKCNGIEQMELTSPNGLGDGGLIVTVILPEEGMSKLAKDTIVDDGVNGAQSIHTSCSQSIAVGDVFGPYTVTNLLKSFNEEEDLRGNKLEIHGSLGVGLPVDLAVDDVVFTIDDGEGHVFEFLVPAGDFEVEGKAAKQKFKVRLKEGDHDEDGDGHAEDDKDLKARLDLLHGKFRLKVKDVQNTNQITGQTLTVRMQVGANIGQEEGLLVIDKKNHLEHKKVIKVECGS